jgi:lipopolysaccharide export LptBFGC system permease protein LptF
MDDQISQQTNRAAQRLDDIIRGRKVPRSYRATDRSNMFLPDGHTLVNFIEFDPDSNTLARPSIYVFDAEMNLRARYLAARARYIGGKWVGENAWSRTFLPDSRERFIPAANSVDLPLSVGPNYFGREYRKPSQMSFTELNGYISTLRAAGYRVDRLRVQLQQKIAYPLSLAILAWVALPLAFRGGRRGALMGIAAALLLGMAYLGLLALFTRLGEASVIDPVLASWTPTAVFALVAAYLQPSLRT